MFLRLLLVPGPPPPHLFTCQFSNLPFFLFFFFFFKEPGLYIPVHPMIPSEFHGIAVRIEDDIWIGKKEGEFEILSVDAPKEVVDIEAVMSN